MLFAMINLNKTGTIFRAENAENAKEEMDNQKRFCMDVWVYVCMVYINTSYVGNSIDGYYQLKY